MENAIVVRLGLVCAAMAPTAGCTGTRCNTDPIDIQDVALEPGEVGVAYDREITVDVEQDVRPQNDITGDVPPGTEVVGGRRDGGPGQVVRLVGTPTQAGSYAFQIRKTTYPTSCNSRSGEFTVTVTIAE